MRTVARDDPDPAPRQPVRKPVFNRGHRLAGEYDDDGGGVKEDAAAKETL
jgi:hypothetical protein